MMLVNAVLAVGLLALMALVGCGRESQAAHPVAEGDIPRTAWPESWFHPPRTASEVGLITFRQSPMLDELVAAGELPPVEERLPDDPIVVEPIDGLGPTEALHGCSSPANSSSTYPREPCARGRNSS